jgi:cytochrome c biogenesis factor
MICAHIGIAVCALGVGLSTAYDAQRDVRMEPGDRVEVSGYQFEFVSLKQVQDQILLLTVVRLRLCLAIEWLLPCFPRSATIALAVRL